MEYDQMGMPPRPTQGTGFEVYDDTPLVQFDVGQNDYVLPLPPQQTKQKVKKSNNAVPGIKQSTGYNFNDPVVSSFAKNDSMKKPDPVQVQYKGYMLKKAQPDVGDQPNWGKVVPNLLPFSNAELAEQSKKVRNETKTDPLTVYSTLSREQCGVVERIIDMLQGEEKSKNAIWVLDSVRKYKEAVKVNLFREERRTSRIQIILKRQDKNALKPGQKPIGLKSTVYRTGEVIDLSEPALKKKEDSTQTLKSNLTQSNPMQNKANIKPPKVKNIQRQQEHQDQHQGFQDLHFPPHQQQWQEPIPLHGEPMMSGGLQDSLDRAGNLPLHHSVMIDHQPPHGHHAKQQQTNQFLPQDIQMPPPPPLPLAPMPPGAIPIDNWAQPQGQTPRSQHRHGEHTHPPQIQHGYDDNPFKPNDNLYNPADYGMSPDPMNNQFSHPLPQTRSYTPGPLYSSRDPSQDRHHDTSRDHSRGLDRDFERRHSRKDDKTTRHNSKILQRKVDNLDDKMEELHHKIDDWKLQSYEDAKDAAHHKPRRLLRERGHRDPYSSDETSSSIIDRTWSPPTLTAGSGGSFTPPSTPPLEYIDSDMPRGSLSRRNTLSGRSTYAMTPRRYSSYRDGGAHVILEPAHSRQHGRRQSEILVLPPQHHSTRPLLHHSTTWQGSSRDRDVVDRDYPNFPLAERPIRLIQHHHPDDYERDRVVYADYGARPKYEGRRVSHARRDSGYGREREWDEATVGGGGAQRVVVLDEGRGRRRNGYVM